MKKNNYVQQLWADNPVFIVWKKIPLSMKLLFVFCFCFVGLLCANDSYAQRTMISVKAQNKFCHKLRHNLILAFSTMTIILM